MLPDWGKLVIKFHAPMRSKILASGHFLLTTDQIRCLTMTHIRRQEMGSVTLDQVVGKRREKPNRDRHGKGLDYCVEVIRRMRNKGERPGCAGEASERKWPRGQK